MSVVIPVYNAGDDMGANIQRLLDQSMPSSEFEVIFVDDGSTDGTGPMLDRLAAGYEHFRVIHIPNSGWPGKPRNIGVENASGQYVFFVDADDYLGEEALERLYAYARANDSDIVLGKKAGVGRGVPRALFRVDRPKATQLNAPLSDSLTVHGLFRRSFLLEHGLRFAECPKRLEDHLFVVHAYLHADTVSVLSNYVCYYHVRRPELEHLSSKPFEPKDYFDSIREGIELVDAHEPPAAARDQLCRRWLRVEMLTKLRGRGFLRADDERKRALIEQIGSITEKYFDTPDVIGKLPIADRIAARLAIARSREDLEEFARYELEMRAQASVSNLELEGDELRASIEGHLASAKQPLEFAYGDDDRLLLSVPLPDGSGLTPHDIDATRSIERARVDLVLSAPDQGEFLVSGKLTPTLHSTDEDDTTRQLTVEGEFTIDLRRAAAGRPLPPGRWRLVARFGTCGWKRDVDLRTTVDGGQSRVAVLIEPDAPPRLVRTGPEPKRRPTVSSLVRRAKRKARRVLAQFRDR